MLVNTFASVVQGIDARLITVEVNAGGTVTNGNNFYNLVGLPDNAIREGFQRIEAAIKNIGYKMMRLKLVINLAPADIRKEGSSYDLPIALGILGATKQIDVSKLSNFVIMGELALDGRLRPIKGALPIAIEARKRGMEGMILPKQNAREAAIVNDLKVYGIDNLNEAVELVSGASQLGPVQLETREIFQEEQRSYAVDFSDVKGQENIKRALEIAASGGHNVILIGPPGAGKDNVGETTVRYFTPIVFT